MKCIRKKNFYTDGQRNKQIYREKRRTDLQIETGRYRQTDRQTDSQTYTRIQLYKEYMTGKPCDSGQSGLTYIQLFNCNVKSD